MSLVFTGMSGTSSKGADLFDVCLQEAIVVFPAYSLNDDCVDSVVLAYSFNELTSSLDVGIFLEFLIHHLAFPDHIIDVDKSLGFDHLQGIVEVG